MCVEPPGTDMKGKRGQKLGEQKERKEEGRHNGTQAFWQGTAEKRCSASHVSCVDERGKGKGRIKEKKAERTIQKSRLPRKNTQYRLFPLSCAVCSLTS